MSKVVDTASFLDGLEISLKMARKDPTRNTIQFAMGVATGQCHRLPTSDFEISEFQGVTLPSFLAGSSHAVLCKELLHATAVGKAAGIPFCQDDWCLHGTPKEREHKRIYVKICEHLFCPGVRYVASTHVFYPIEEMDKEKAFSMYLGNHTDKHNSLLAPDVLRMGGIVELLGKHYLVSKMYYGRKVIDDFILRFLAAREKNARIQAWTEGIERHRHPCATAQEIFFANPVQYRVTIDRVTGLVVSFAMEYEEGSDKGRGYVTPIYHAMDELMLKTPLQHQPSYIIQLAAVAGLCNSSYALGSTLFSLQNLLQTGGMAAVDTLNGGLGELVIRRQRQIFGATCVGTSMKRHQPHVGGNMTLKEYWHNCQVLHETCARHPPADLSVDFLTTSRMRRTGSTTLAQGLCKESVNLGPLTCSLPMHLLGMFMLIGRHHLAYSMGNPRRMSPEMKSYVENGDIPEGGGKESKSKDVLTKYDRINQSSVRFFQRHFPNGDAALLENMDCASSRKHPPKDTYFPGQPIVRRITQPDGTVEMEQWVPVLKREAKFVFKEYDLVPTEEIELVRVPFDRIHQEPDPCQFTVDMVKKLDLSNDMPPDYTSDIGSQLIDIDQNEKSYAMTFVNKHGLHEGGDSLDETYSGSLMFTEDTDAVTSAAGRNAMRRKLFLTKNDALDKSGRFMTVVIPIEDVLPIPRLPGHIHAIFSRDRGGKNLWEQKMQQIEECPVLMRIIARRLNQHLQERPSLSTYQNAQGPRSFSIPQVPSTEKAPAVRQRKAAPKGAPERPLKHQKAPPKDTPTVQGSSENLAERPTPKPAPKKKAPPPKLTSDTNTQDGDIESVAAAPNDVAILPNAIVLPRTPRNAAMPVAVTSNAVSSTSPVPAVHTHSHGYRCDHLPVEGGRSVLLRVCLSVNSRAGLILPDFLGFGTGSAVSLGNKVNTISKTRGYGILFDRSTFTLAVNMINASYDGKKNHRMIPYQPQQRKFESQQMRLWDYYFRGNENKRWCVVFPAFDGVRSLSRSNVCRVRDTIARQLHGSIDEETGSWMFHNQQIALSHAGLCLMCQAVNQGGYSYLLRQLSAYSVDSGRYPRDTTVVGFSTNRSRSRQSCNQNGRDQVLFYIIFRETANREYDFSFAIPDYQLEMKLSGMSPIPSASVDGSTSGRKRRRQTQLVFVKPGLV